MWPDHLDHLRTRDRRNLRWRLQIIAENLLDFGVELEKLLRGQFHAPSFDSEDMCHRMNKNARMVNSVRLRGMIQSSHVPQLDLRDPRESPQVGQNKFVDRTNLRSESASRVDRISSISSMAMLLLAS